MDHKVKSVCVYCGASGRVDKSYFDLATLSGKFLAQSGKSLVYGGSHIGLMGTVADAVLENGGEVVGIIPHHLFAKEPQHEGITRLIVVDTMHDRKAKMVELADAFVILPGGLGTMEEAFEIITWKQLGLHDKPVILMNFNGYWDGFVSLVQNIVDRGFAKPEHLDLFAVISDPADLPKALDASSPPEFSPSNIARW